MFLRKQNRMGEIKIWERERVKNTGRALAFCAGNGTPYPWEGAKIDKQTLQGTCRTQELPPPHGSNVETFMKSTLLEMGLKSLRRMVVYQGFI
jgi:hypothetical protein